MPSPNTTTWMTIEETPRRLTVKGPSAIDSDCLVAYEDGSDRPLWIVLGTKPDCFVCGLNVRAKLVEERNTDAT